MQILSIGQTYLRQMNSYFLRIFIRWSNQREITLSMYHFHWWTKGYVSETHVMSAIDLLHWKMIASIIITHRSHSSTQHSSRVDIIWLLIHLLGVQLRNLYSTENLCKELDSFRKSEMWFGVALLIERWLTHVLTRSRPFKIMEGLKDLQTE